MPLERVLQPGFVIDLSPRGSERSRATADPAPQSLAVENAPIIQWAIWAPAANQSQGNWLRTP